MPDAGSSAGFGAGSSSSSSSSSSRSSSSSLTSPSSTDGINALCKPAGASQRKASITRTQLAHRIAQGETLVLHAHRVYKLDNWLAQHPGGALAILHFVGRDASDEIEAYHCDQTLRRMSAFVVAHFDLQDQPLYKPLVPPVQLGYRKGRGLDHPHAHLDTWQRYLDRRPTAALATGQQTSPAALSPARPTDFPLPVELLEPPPDPPCIDATKEAQISRAYKQLHQQVKDAGLYQLRPIGYVRECTRYALLGLLAFYFYAFAHGRTSYFLLSSTFLGLLWHQATFTAHDAGHSGITHNHAVDRVIGTLIADFLGGLSIGWWCDNHDIHHLVTNHPEHDPDIQHMPFFAISPKFLVWQRDGPTSPKVEETKAGEEEENKTSKADQDTVTIGLWSSYYRRVLAFDAPSRLFLRFQHKLYYVVMSLGRFNLYSNSYSFLLLQARRDRWFYLELLGLAFWTRWYIFGALAHLPSWKLRIAYVLISHVLTSPLHIQIVLSHFAQSSDDLGLSESFARRQIRTTMDVQCPTYLDFLHGGLHMQVSHHLFPRLPRHNLREARDRFVKPFAHKWGIEYEEYAFANGNGRVLKVLQQVAEQVDLLAKVARAQAKCKLH
ncbi:fatty acid/sphingolipid desaturase [Tilletiaria anomala UBC 951]|uniref:Delta 8-(E)-sphingolipid desaturase n=1 Tax=Tilletiaria anomala (strain ATCC 24038 / CBS 436.72 / UBC 951) TaxID=1037660 RepID=A0A066VHU6_TILAU|nr:fatty acid/sphingolipid desaturase [Tilletiaria anomala UBC 951]KDN39838.1 fatty acid/sphingolipid desaturase [Tilletiaria anomala UBC 951]